MAVVRCTLHTGFLISSCALCSVTGMLSRSARCLVRAEFTGFEEVNGSIPLPRESDRIWRGSYKGKDWRYLVSLTRPAQLCVCVSCRVPASLTKNQCFPCSADAMRRDAVFK